MKALKLNRVTMLSTEIAGLTGKRHDHVVRDIRDLLGRLGSDFYPINEVKDMRGYTKHYALDFKQALTLISSYSLSVSAPVVNLIAEKLSQHNEVMDAIRNFDLSELPPSMFVYVIKNTATGNMKVGISSNPERRLKQLQIGCDGELELIATISAENGYKSESKAHKKLVRHHIHGEWFSSSQQLAVAAIQ